MLRQLHSLPGLIVALFVIVLSVTGAILSLNPALERAGTVVPATEQVSVAELAGKIKEHYPRAEQIERTPSGTLIVYYTRDGQVRADRVDPRTGQAIAPYESSSFSRWVKNLHRSLLLDMPGRAVSGITALAMVVLAISGAMLLAARLGGWRQLLHPVRGTLSQRLHIELGRAAILGLLLSGLTGSYLSATTFGLASEGVEAEPEFPLEVDGGPPAAIDTLSALKTTDLSDLRELVYPYPDDPTDMYSLGTDQGAGYIDQASGEWLAYQPHDATHKFYEFIYRLHTGEGLWWLGLTLGLAALTVPVMAVTGTMIWWKRHRSKPKLAANSGPNAADSVILVGSEGNTTWGFAKTLHDSLVQAGQRVHTAPMNQLAPRYRSAKRLFILTATYGDGDAPASANQFLARLEKIKEAPRLSTAVLGFGDRQFPQFCGFAKEVEAALIAKGWQQLLPLDTINRQSPQEFTRWGDAVGKVLGTELTLVHTPVRPRTAMLELAERVDYGTDVQAPTAVLRFKVPEGSGKTGLLSRLLGRTGLPHFEAGDLVGILPPDSQVPRFYSLASASKDGMLEICVRHHPGGLCSSFLHALPIGGTIEAFIQPNPDFRPASGKAPIVLIGAGTGIGPLVGFIRHNKAHHPMHLYWGGRNPQSDFLYEPELNAYLADRRLTELNTVFSRVDERAYVQDKIAVDGPELRRLIEKGAQILVCGGRDMAASVMAALNDIVAPLGMDVATLKAQGRYREDVY
ncbi:sulfite reductase (NADPH) flavoprotein alpha-component [Modicisalibacter ilicicola DSM 19980]|uniref:Sulfite reductase (NADPH) flavoprotein alpha-component n=1 Tax=Modicisalibacter ilicicola DSM 19980 TaxID=1121942 RepID=A0A1M4SI12_9GAMM|nr:PepSY domain-containing protein [Halomonas ilicicola]SHE31627.1 sulfite reductase (NADPH) flavoprotein alpha-component [Halomonas ilicicola DSM 19980]